MYLDLLIILIIKITKVEFSGTESASKYENPRANNIRYRCHVSNTMQCRYNLYFNFSEFIA